MNEIAISINNLTVSYNQRPVLRGVTAKLEKAQIVAILGPNGAGKSTLLKAILGLIPCDSGEISIFGQKIAAYRRQIAYIPQKEQIDWDFPVVVQDVVMMGRYPALGWLRRPSQNDYKLIEGALREVGMEELAMRHIRLLSGGQQQRVFLARALVQQASILLMDEPFVGVDATTQTAILALVDKLKQAGKTIVIINHDLSLCKRFDTIMLLNKQLIAMGSPQEVYTEENLRRTYGGQMTMVDQAEFSLWKAQQ